MKVKPRGLATLAMLVFAVLCLFAAAFMLHRTRSRQPDEISNPPIVQPSEYGLGANVDLLGLPPQEAKAALERLQEAGFVWVRQHFDWSVLEPLAGEYNWEASDTLVQSVAALNMHLLAVVGSAPEWARGEGQERWDWSPPSDYAAFGNFAAQFASRYGDVIDYYEVWDQPNIYPYWGDQFVDAAAYTRLLKEAASSIRENDTTAWIVLAGLAPNVETGPLNLNEMDYLRQVYQNGGADFFDIVAAKAYGFAAEPDSGAQSAVLNFSRVSLLRQVMRDHGDLSKPVWAVEFGWNALPEDWTGTPAPWESDTVAKQVERSSGAVRKAREEWPWMGPMLWPGLLAPADPDDPRYGFALMERDLSLTELGAAILESLPKATVPRLGYHEPTSLDANYFGEWQVNERGADPSDAGDSVEIKFTGTALDLLLRPGPYWGIWYISVDGAPSSILPQENGRSYAVLYDPLGQERRERVAAGLSFGQHVVQVEVDGGWEQWPLAGWVSYSEQTRSLPVFTVISAVAAVFFLAVTLLLHDWSAFEALFECVDSIENTLPGWLGGVLVLASGLGFWRIPGLTPSLLLGFLFSLTVFIWPSWGAAMVGLTLPFFMIGKPLYGFQLLMPEFAAWLVLAAAVMRWLGRRQGRSLTVTLRALDAGIIVLGLAAVIACIVAPLTGVAFHDYRRVILSATAFYFGLRIMPAEQKEFRALSGLITGAAFSSLLALRQFVIGANLIRATGVARVRALYGSPNNLALYLERVLPLPVALAMNASDKKWRRCIWIGLAVVIGAAAVLTRSRGLLLLALPVSTIYLLWRMRRPRLIVGLLIIVAMFVIVLIGGGDRVRSLVTGQDEAASIRLDLWRSAIRMIEDYPVFGVGLDNFLYQYRTRYILPSAWREPNLSHPHNVFLDFWISTGFVGLLSFMWLIFWVVRVVIIRRDERLDSPRSAVYIGVQAALLGAIAHGMVDNFMFLVDLSHILFCYLALMGNRGDKVLLRFSIGGVRKMEALAGVGGGAE